MLLLLLLLNSASVCANACVCVCVRVCEWVCLPIAVYSPRFFDGHIRFRVISSTGSWQWMGITVRGSLFGLNKVRKSVHNKSDDMASSSMKMCSHSYSTPSFSAIFTLHAAADVLNKFVECVRVCVCVVEEEHAWAAHFGFCNFIDVFYDGAMGRWIPHLILLWPFPLHQSALLLNECAVCETKPFYPFKSFFSLKENRTMYGEFVVIHFKIQYIQSKIHTISQTSTTTWTQITKKNTYRCTPYTSTSIHF